jgi:hypothetical protein
MRHVLACGWGKQGGARAASVVVVPAKIHEHVTVIYPKDVE